MYLFVFESIGTSELILVGIVALMFLGPRKLPEIARKIGKIMAEFRGTANEFKDTWQREVSFEEEAKALNIKDIDDEAMNTEVASQVKQAVVPEVKAVDPTLFEEHRSATGSDDLQEKEPELRDEASDKRTWL